MLKWKSFPMLLKWLLENSCYLRQSSSTSLCGSRACSTHLEPGFEVAGMEPENVAGTMVGNGSEVFTPEKESEEPKEVSVSEQKSLRVAVVGTPNSGKSTLINQLLGKKVLAVSPKAHTTCRRALGVFTDANIQITLTDTPGTIPSGYARSLGMSRQFTADPGRSLMDADLVAVMVDAANKMTRERLDLNVLRLLEKHPHIPSILVLNKVDLVKPKTILLRLAELLSGSDDTHRHRIGYLVRKWKDKRISLPEKTEIKVELNKLRKELADKKRLQKEHLCTLKRAQMERDERDGVKETEVGVVDHDHAPDATPTSLTPRPAVAMNCWAYFKEIFMVSALDGDGLEKLQEYLLSSAKLREWEYSVSEITDQPLVNLVEDIIREKILLHTDKEIPYVTRQENVIWERDESGLLTIYQYLHCGKRSRAAILVGSRGSMIQTIREEATRDIEALLNCPVQLTLHVKK